MPLSDEDEFDIPAWAHNLRAMLEELDETEKPTKKQLADMLSTTLDIIVEMIQRMVIWDYDIKVLDKAISKIAGYEELTKDLKEAKENAQKSTAFEDITLSLFS